MSRVAKGDALAHRCPNDFVVELLESEPCHALGEAALGHTTLGLLAVGIRSRASRGGDLLLACTGTARSLEDMCGRTVDRARLGGALVGDDAVDPAGTTFGSRVGLVIVDEHTIALSAVTDLEKFLAGRAVLHAGFGHALFLGGVVDLELAALRLCRFGPNTEAA